MRGGPAGGGGQKFYCHLAGLVSMCRRTTIIFFISLFAGPCFHVMQDDNKIWGWGPWGGEVRGGSDQWGWGVSSLLEKGGVAFVFCGLCFVSLVSSGDLSVLWIGRGTVGRWPWACGLGGFYNKGPDFQ